MRTLQGLVTSRSGTATENLRPVMSLIAERIQLPALCEGTLNIQTGEFYIVQSDAAIAPDEYKWGETLKLQRCRLNIAGRSLRCCIMRPDTHEPDHANVLELMHPEQLREFVGLANGDEVAVEVEGDDTWWNAPESG